MGIVSSSIDNVNRKSWFLENTFLWVDISIDITHKMLFFNICNVSVNFTNWKLKKRLYINIKVLHIILWEELIGEKEFAVITLNPNNETWIIYVSFLISSDLDLEIHFSWIAQIVFLNTNKTLTSVHFESTNFVDICFINLATKLLEHIKINNYTIDLVED